MSATIQLGVFGDPLSHTPLSVNEARPETKLTLGMHLGTWGRQGHVVLAGCSPPARSREVSLMWVLEGVGVSFWHPGWCAVTLHLTDSEPWHVGSGMGPVSRCSQILGELCLPYHSMGAFGCPRWETEAAGKAVVVERSVYPKEQ